MDLNSESGLSVDRSGKEFHYRNLTELMELLKLLE